MLRKKSRFATSFTTNPPKSPTRVVRSCKTQTCLSNGQVCADIFCRLAEARCLFPAQLISVIAHMAYVRLARPLQSNDNGVADLPADKFVASRKYNLSWTTLTS